MAQSDWLYPISETAGTYWLDKKRKIRARISLENFRDLVVPGVLDDGEWFLGTNYRNVSAGDRVWIYLSGGTGVIGVATVREVRSRRGRWFVDLSFKKAASRRLCARPYSGRRVQPHVPFPRAAVAALDPHPRLVKALERAAGL